jgi:hypothetical protein
MNIPSKMKERQNPLIFPKRVSLPFPPSIHPVIKKEKDQVNSSSPCEEIEAGLRFV